MKAPFVWFGGKRRVAPEVWAALGDVPNYIEPFAGSLAVLLGRPHDMSNGTRRAETVNDDPLFLDLMADIVLDVWSRYRSGRPLWRSPVTANGSWTRPLPSARRSSEWPSTCSPRTLCLG